MKKKSLLSLLLCLYMLLSLPTTVLAESGHKAKIDELGISITIPAEYKMLTRETPDKDSDLKAQSMTKSQLLEKMKSSGLFLWAWDIYDTAEITVAVDETTFRDFHRSSDDALMVMMSQFESIYKKAGASIVKHEIYPHSQTKFIKLIIKEPESSNSSDADYSMMYYTVIDEKIISLELKSYSKKMDITNNNEKSMDSIVDSIIFETIPTEKTSNKETASFRFNDDFSGCKFTVPANWSKVDVSTDKGSLHAEFDYNRAPEYYIQYGSADICVNLTGDEKIENARQMFDSSSLTADDYADMVGASGNEVSIVKYAGKEYFKTESLETISVKDKNVVFAATVLARFENGYMYTFKFHGDPKSTYYKDFEELVKSVKYPGRTK